jgi:hypothetical protein
MGPVPGGILVDPLDLALALGQKLLQFRTI